MEHIIVGIDAESPSEQAVGWVIRRSRDTAMRVTLVTAFDSLIDDPMAARARLIGLADRITSVDPSVVVDIELANASIHRALEERSWYADLMVIGSHRTRPIRSMLSGGLPARVAARAHCPIVIVPEDWKPLGGPIVVGIAEDSSSEPALGFAAREAERQSVELDLVHAWLPDSPTRNVAVALLVAATAPDVRAFHHELLSASAELLRGAYPRVEIVEHLDQDRTADALAERSKTAQLVVIGTHHHGPEAGLLLGSIAGHLLRESSSVICIVPTVEVRSASEEPAQVPIAAAGVGAA
jgi:nucleotide-binding universal stress UspA family protein